MNILIAVAAAYTPPIPQCVSQAVPAREHSDPPSLLIGIVSGSSPQTLTRVQASMQNMAHEQKLFPAWAIALYAGDVADWETIEFIASKLKVTLTIYDARKGRRCPFCPKLQFQIEMAHLAQDYDYVWLADEDMSFAHFALRDFWEFHRSGNAPLLAQPTILQHTQQPFFNVTHGPWAACAPWLKTVRTTFVEEQTPVFDTRFFLWLAPRLAEIARAQQLLGTSWSHDLIWCGAAKIYADTRHLPNPPCALVLVPQNHQNSHDLQKTDDYYTSSYSLISRLQSRDFNATTNKMVNAAAALCKESLMSPDPWFLQNNIFEGVCRRKQPHF